MKYIKSAMATALMLLVTSGAWADATVTIKKKVDGVESVGASSPGTVTESINSGTCTLTVTPATGNYADIDCITASATVEGDAAQVRPQTPNLNITTITVTPTDATADPSTTTTYTFTMPADGSDVEVTVDFKSRKSVSDLTIADIETQEYTGSAIEPVLQVSDGETSLTLNTDYTVGYTNNTATGTATATLTGRGKYMGSREVNFTILQTFALWVAGTQVTSNNLDNVLGQAKPLVNYNPETNTLTLNVASVYATDAAGVKSGMANLNVLLEGGRSEINCRTAEYYAFEGTVENATVTFRTSESPAGYLDITTAGYNKFFKDITPVYEGVTHFDKTSVYSNEYYYLIRKSPWTGSGTSEDPYLISTVSDLRTLSSYIYQGIVITQYFKLNNNLDFENESTFTSIGKRYSNYKLFSFNGTFDGNYKTISNMKSEYGLFVYVMDEGGEGTIKNLTLDNCEVTGGSDEECVGGIVAEFRSGGKIENCTFKNGTISNGNYASITSGGGIAGYQHEGVIDNCIVEDATISMGGSPSYSLKAGGIVGHTYWGSTVSNCLVKATEDVTKITNLSEATDKTLYTGAIVGWRESTTTLTNNFYQAGVVVESQKGNEAMVSKSDFRQRGLGDGDDLLENSGAMLEGVTKLTVSVAETGSVEGIQYYMVDGTDYYMLPGWSLFIKATPNTDYDTPAITFTDADGEPAELSYETVDKYDETGGEPFPYLHTEWEIVMPEVDMNATVSFLIDLGKDGRLFTIDDTEYTGSAIAPTTIKTKQSESSTTEITLTAGTDFTITSYNDNDGEPIGATAPADAGNYQAVILGKGNCTGTATVDFTITPATATLTASNQTVTYNGSAQEFDRSKITINPSTLLNDLTFAYYTEDPATADEPQPMDAPSTTGTYYVEIELDNGNYVMESVVKTLTISPKSIAEATVTVSGTYTYSGSAIEPATEAITVKDGETTLMAGTDYTISYSDNINAGTSTGKVIVTGKGNYDSSTTATGTFTIAPKSIVGATVTVSGSYTYTGSAIEPATETVTVKDGETTLTVGTDYTISYSDNINAGTSTGKVIVTGKGNYDSSTTATGTFTIAPKSIAEATVTVSGSYTYTGSAIEPGTDAITVKDGETTLTAGNDYTISYSDNTNTGTATVTVTGKGNYDSSTTATGTFVIANRTVTADELGLSENQTYGTYYTNTEDLLLPEGIVAYIITGVEGTSVATKRISYIPKGAPVLVELGTSTEEASNDATGNQLQGTTDAKNVTTITGGSVYVLYKGEFVKTIAGTIPAHRCYLVLSEENGGGARSLSIGHGNIDATGIDNVMLEENGTEQWYDLQGRRIQKPMKEGIYILNGKKKVYNNK